MDRRPVLAETVGLTELDGRAERTWQSWQEPSPFRYDIVGQRLPELIRDAQGLVLGVNGGERRQALRLASKVYQLARTWTKRVGEHELSLVSADRAVTCAIEADDPDLAGAAAWNMAMILSTQGKIEHAQEVVRRAIGDLQPGLGRQPTRARMAVLGGLHLMGATEAARDDKTGEAHALLEVAASIAVKTGETNDFRMVFGPTNVALHRVSTLVELGRTNDALELAERVAVQESPAVERRLTFRLDAARCYARKGNDVAALHMIQHIHRESPEELRYSVLVRETIRQLRGRAKAGIMTELEPLLTAASLPD
jgi:hypothetical protein